MHALAVLAAHQPPHDLRHHFHGPGVDYVAVLLGCVLSGLGFSGPGEALLVAAGIAAAHHRVDLTGVTVVAWFGVTLGGVIGYAVGHRVGRPLMTGPGPARRMRVRLIGSGDRFYQRHGALAVIFGPPWMAGINHMDFRRFLVVSAVWGLVWALALGVGAYVLGPTIAEWVSDLGTYGLVALGVLALAYAVWRVRRRRRDALEP